MSFSIEDERLVVEGLGSVGLSADGQVAIAGNVLWVDAVGVQPCGEDFAPTVRVVLCVLDGTALRGGGHVSMLALIRGFVPPAQFGARRRIGFEVMGAAGQPVQGDTGH